MIRRDLTPVLQREAGRYPVVTLTGPRQSGKTTVCRGAFPDHAYASLEPLDTREFARDDPRGFLAQYGEGVILDEVQRVPELLSYVQGVVDADPRPGRFILTGSEHFGLSEAIAQSLAGRTAVLHLFAPSLGELRRFENAPSTLWETLFTGAYPRIFDANIPPQRWLADYLATYVQRDVRQLLNVGDLTAFTTFVRLAAARTAQELNLADLGADVGVTRPTAAAWLSVLEASFLAFRLPAFHRNVRKRLVKSPKVHFFDSGLVCHLLGLEEAAQLVTHPQRGAIFESWVVAEIYKARAHAGLEPRLAHARVTRGPEVDCIVEAGGGFQLVEVKSGATARSAFLKPLADFAEQLEETGVDGGAIARRLVYGGEERQTRTYGEVVPWHAMAEVAWG